MSSFNHNLRLNALNERVGVCGLLIYEAQASFYVCTQGSCMRTNEEINEFSIGEKKTKGT